MGEPGVCGRWAPDGLGEGVGLEGVVGRIAIKRVLIVRARGGTITSWLSEA